MQGDLDQEAWERSHIEAALSEADTGDFLPEKEMAAKFNQLGQRKNAEADRWKLENHEAIQELNRIVEEGVVSRNRRNFRHPSSSPATSASRSMTLPSLWKV